MLPCKSLSSVYLVSCLLFVTGAQLEGHGFSCKDQKDNNVDWFAVYKAPIIPDRQDNNDVRDGKAFVYMDANSNKPSWQLSTVPISDKSGHAIANTLEQVYVNKDTKDVAYLLYNDQNPVGKKRSGRGHAKGVVLFNKIGGFWLVHSLPRFPSHTDDGYSWPDNGKVNGQVFLCMTYPFSQFSKIAHQLQFYRPRVYDHKIEDFSNEITALNNLVDEKIFNKEWKPAVKFLSTSGDQLFVNIAKNRYTHEDIYTYLIARLPRMKDAYVQTWKNGRGTKIESCSYDKEGSVRRHVLDIKKIQLSDGIAFLGTKDHSKWAVSDNQSEPWVCIGDLNRMESQMKLGGGLVCMQHSEVWKAFQGIIDDANTVDDVGKPCPEIKSILLELGSLNA